MALYIEAVIVGHVPHNLAPRLSAFLRRDVNKVFAQVTGDKINKGAGYGLEVPCVYRLYTLTMMKELFDTLTAAGLL